jgi:hypothetical protein
MSEETLENSQVRMQEFAIQGEADLEHHNIDVNVQSRISRFFKAIIKFESPQIFKYL